MLYIFTSKLDKKIYKFIIVRLCNHKFKEKFFKSLRRNKMAKPNKEKNGSAFSFN